MPFDELPVNTPVDVCPNRVPETTRDMFQIIDEKCVLSSTLRPALVAANKLLQTSRAKTHIPLRLPADHVMYEVEFLNESGAGRTVASKRSLLAQGVPKSVIHKYLSRATENLDFDIGGRTQNTTKSLGISGDAIGNDELFCLKDAPFAVSMGRTVNRYDRPHIWLPGQLPFHVTNASKRKIWCPM